MGVAPIAAPIVVMDPQRHQVIEIIACIHNFQIIVLLFILVLRIYLVAKVGNIIKVMELATCNKIEQCTLD